MRTEAVVNRAPAILKSCNGTAGKGLGKVPRSSFELA